MKRKLCALFLTIAFCITLFSGLSTTASAAPSGFNYNTAKLVTLFFTQCLNSDDSLSTSFDWYNFANSDANGIVIIPYKPLDGGRNYWDIGRYGLSQYTTLAQITANVITELVSNNSNIKVWFGTPAITSNCFPLATCDNCLTIFTNYVSAVKSYVGNTIWNQNVCGVYYDQESIYGDVNYNALTTNEEILLMNCIAYRVHANFEKDMLWIPYYGYGTNAGEIIKRIGYLSERSPIFDCIILQSTYLSHNDAESLSNFNGISYSMDINAICYRNAVQVIERSASANAIIGAEYEINTYNTTTLNIYRYYYDSYLGSKPMAIYWQGSLSSAISYINSIY